MSRRLTVAVQFALIAPAALFLLAVNARGIAPLESGPARAAQSIVTWYSGHVWTLWVLLLALPIGAFLIGGAELLGSREAPVARRSVTGAGAAATMVAGLIIAAVILHMLAN